MKKNSKKYGLTGTMAKFSLGIERDLKFSAPQRLTGKTNQFFGGEK